MDARSSAPVHIDGFPMRDDGKQTTFCRRYHAHGDKWIDVVYTNEARGVNLVLDMYIKWLETEKNKFVGLDLEYDFAQKMIAVMQFGLKDHVLVFHKIRCKDYVPRLTKFLKDEGITFVVVDKRRDSYLLKKYWLHIPCEKYIDIQDVYKIEGKIRAGMADLAVKLIDKKFKTMKSDFKKDELKREGHDYWEWKPLSEKNLEYAALDAYITYELYYRISIVNEGQVHLKPVAICPSCSASKSEENNKKLRNSPVGWE